MYKHREFDAAEKATLCKLHREAAWLEESLMACLPAGRERSIVLSHLEDAMLHVGCAIAENGITDAAREKFNKKGGSKE